MLAETQKAIEATERAIKDWPNANHAPLYGMLALVHEISEQNKVLNICAKQLERIADRIAPDGR